MRRNLEPAKIQQVQEVAKEMKQNNQECDAFSLSEHLFSRASAQDPFEFIRLLQSSGFSNYAYLVHPNVPIETKTALRQFLVSQKVQKKQHKGLSE